MLLVSFWNHHRTDILYTIRHLRHNVRRARGKGREEASWGASS